MPSWRWISSVTVLPALVTSRVNAEMPRETMFSDVDELEGVLDAERVDVDDLGLEARLAHDAGEVVDLVLLRGHEQEVHLTGLGAAAQDLVVDVHDLDVEGNVLLGLPRDLLGELGLRHDGDGDLADDDALPVDADGNVTRGNALRGPDRREGVDDGRAVHDVAVDDGLRGQRRDAVANHRETFASLAELHDLDRARADVDADEVLAVCH
jgi:hypothetical protein